MNLWVAWHPGTRAEAELLSHVSCFFKSTKSGGPVNGQVQDSIIGCERLTATGTVLDAYHVASLFATAGMSPRLDVGVAGVGTADVSAKGVAVPGVGVPTSTPTWTGRDVASLVLAEYPINYRGTPTCYSSVYAAHIAYDPADIRVEIRQGRLVSGVLDKAAVGAKATGGVHDLVAREYGPQAALDQIFALQQVALAHLAQRGFTVAADDLLPSPTALARIREVVDAARIEGRLVSERLVRGEIVPPIDSTVHDFYEQLMREALKPSEAELLRWVLSGVRPATNGFFRMVADGAKGTNANLIQVCGAIGQTEVNGARLPEDFSFRRTNPYSPRYDLSETAYGFVGRMYAIGMGLIEFLGENRKGRHDLITKALSTASTGYFMRKGVMCLQSAITDCLRRVTKAGAVVQLLYGEDGLDPRSLERVPVPTAELDDDALRRWLFGVDVPTMGVDVSTVEAAARADRDWFRRQALAIEGMNFGQVYSGSVHTTVNVRRIIEGVFIAAGTTMAAALEATVDVGVGASTVDVGVGASTVDVGVGVPTGTATRIQRCEDLCRRLPYVYMNEDCERAGRAVPPHYALAARQLAMLVRAELTPRVLCRLTDRQLDFIIDQIRVKYALGMIEYGTAVGIHAAQAVSEPLTQYMLDSHHRSVGAGTNTTGLVRVQEIFGAAPASAEKSARMLLPLRAELAEDTPANREAAARIATELERLALQDFIDGYDVVVEPYPTAAEGLAYPAAAADAAWIRSYERDHPLSRPPADLTRYCFRFQLSKAVMVLKALDLETVVQRLRVLNPAAHFVHTSEAAGRIVVRAWLTAGAWKKGANVDKELRASLARMLEAPIRGIPGVVRAAVTAVARHRVGPGGAFTERKCLAVETVGSNLHAVLYHSAFDPAAVVSSSVGDTLKLFGIEAARAKILSEIRGFMDRNTPNLRHLQVYASEMTRTGRVTSIERGGLAVRERENVLLRMALAGPIQVVTDAALETATSRVYGMAAPQLLGQTPRVGSLLSTCVVNEEFVRAHMRSVDSVLDSL